MRDTVVYYRLKAVGRVGGAGEGLYLGAYSPGVPTLVPEVVSYCYDFREQAAEQALVAAPILDVAFDVERVVRVRGTDVVVAVEVVQTCGFFRDIEEKPGVVCFKHEDEVDGQAVGPVWLSNDPDPPRNEWMTLREARRYAKALNLKLEER